MPLSSVLFSYAHREQLPILLFLLVTFAFLITNIKLPQCFIAQRA